IPERETETEVETEKEREAEVASRAKPRSPRPPQECGEDILVELQNSPAYAHLDVRLCYFKMVEWCKRNRKVPSERRFINWLNHEDKPMTAKSKPPPKANVGAPAPLAP